jgi:ribose transport system ATP-binding protein
LGEFNSKTDFSAIWGSSIDASARFDADAENAISVSALDGKILSNLSFTARAGEIVGFAGLRGSGVEELPRILSGDSRGLKGKISISGRELGQRCFPSEIINSGLVAIPADRLRAGGIGSFDVRENIILPRMSAYWHQPNKWREAVSSVINSFGVEPQMPRRLFRNFSGGNQQKILLGKWLLLKPKVFVLDDPTYGVDPAARETIFNALTDAAARGVCVLFFSSEPEQLVRICDRVLVLGNGNIVKELAGEEKTLETVTEWSYQ